MHENVRFVPRELIELSDIEFNIDSVLLPTPHKPDSLTGNFKLVRAR
jgi:hypothetical protein